MTHVQGYCPMGCGETLMLGAGGYVTCGYLGCTVPDAVSTIIGVGETEHVVTLGETDFSILHPLRERLNDELQECDLHEHLRWLDGPPRVPGTYRASRTARGGWSWALIPDGAA